MWRNYLTVGLRVFTRNWTYTLITIFGLVLGLAACLTCLLYVRYELSYDRWISGADQAFQLQNIQRAGPEGGEDIKQQMTSFVSGKALAKDFPQVENSVFVLPTNAVVTKNGDPTFANDFVAVDGDLFDIIQIPFVSGDPKHALKRPGDAVLTESEARRLFPDQDARGKTLTLTAFGVSTDYRVNGILRDLPKNTHLRLGIVARFDPESAFAATPQLLRGWRTYMGYVYVKLRPGSNAESINAQLPAWKKRNIPDDANHGNAGEIQDWRLTNIRDIHLGEAQVGAESPGNDKGTVLAFAAIALLILGMAIINFINLATARASQRALEVALRKVVGASRRQLIVQFVAESVLVTAIAMLLGLALAEILLPYVNGFLDIDMGIHYSGSDGLLLPIMALLILVGGTAGLYPAFYLSRFEPGGVLKASRSTSDTQGSGMLRTMLVVSQFTVSIGLMICTAVIYSQTIYARTADAGYKRDGLLQVENISSKMTALELETLVREVERVPGVRSASLTEIGVARDYSMSGKFLMPGIAKPIDLDMYSVDSKFFDTMEMTLLAGRTFNEKIASDDATFPATLEAVRTLMARGANIVVTETAARKIGYTTPQAAIGRQIRLAGSPETGDMPFTIVGVVKDARIRSIRVPLQPILYRFARNPYKQMMVRYESAQPNQLVAEVEKVWRRIARTVPFEGKFVDERLRELYKADDARGQIFAVFALLAVVIGCLGLFGLAVFTAERRTKEIGVRKVLGARTRDIVGLLAWQFSKPVVIANLIAWPIAWYFMRDWLNGFDARIDLSPIYFLAAGAIALAIAIGTVSSHAIRIARTNPIHALRNE